MLRSALGRGSEALHEAEPRAAPLARLDLQLVGERADDGDAEAALAHPVRLGSLVQHESLAFVGHLDRDVLLAELVNDLDVALAARLIRVANGVRARLR